MLTATLDQFIFVIFLPKYKVAWLASGQAPCIWVEFFYIHRYRLIYLCFWFTEIQEGGACVLSSKTARDIGSLDTQNGIRSDSFHFEMKPSLG